MPVLRVYPDTYRNDGTWEFPDSALGVEDNNCAQKIGSGSTSRKLFFNDVAPSALVGFDFSALPDDAIISQVTLAVRGWKTLALGTTCFIVIIAGAIPTQVNVDTPTGAYVSCAASPYWVTFNVGHANLWGTVSTWKTNVFQAYMEHKATLSVNQSYCDSVYIEITYTVPVVSAGGVSTGNTLFVMVLAALQSWKRKLRRKRLVAVLYR